MTKSDPKSLIRLARANGENVGAAPLDLGARVRALRKARDWTLEQAARQAGLARSTLSKIENGQMSPTYDALKKLAVGLEISIPQLFTPPQAETVNGRLAVTKSGDGSHQMTVTYEHELLANTLPRSRCYPIAHVCEQEIWQTLTDGYVMTEKSSSMC